MASLATRPVVCGIVERFRSVAGPVAGGDSSARKAEDGGAYLSEQPPYVRAPSSASLAPQTLRGTACRVSPCTTMVNSTTP